MEKKLDDHNYWRERHKSREGSVSSVGNLSYSEKANYYTYRILKEQYAKILGRLDLPSDKSALDAGAGVGIFSEFLVSRGFKVTAVDISEIALAQINNQEIEKVACPLNVLDLGSRKFDVVHSFDVLYHLIDDLEWRDALSRICQHSNKYVILHERFLTGRQLVSSRHVRLRPYHHTSSVLQENGFQEKYSIPTHFLALRLLTYRLSKYCPRMFYHLDRGVLNVIEDTIFSGLGSHHIKVFEKK